MKDFERKRLVGSWQLHRWFITYEDGTVTEPLVPARSDCSSIRRTAG